MLKVNIPHVLVFYEHSILFPLELLFQWIHHYFLFRGYLISSVHARFFEQKMVFRSNMQVFGSTCGSTGSNQYQHDRAPYFTGSKIINIVKIQPLLNLTQFKSKQLYVTRVEVRHSSHVSPTPPHPTTNFSATSRHARKLKFGMVT